MWHPICLDVEVTSRCNLGCAHCYLGPPGEGQMAHETARRVVAYLAQQSVWRPPWEQPILNLYGGEPTLNMPVVRYLVANAPWARCTLFTNGASSTEHDVRWLQTRNVQPRRSTAGCPEAAALTRPGDYTHRWLEEGKWWLDFATVKRLAVTPATAPYVCASVRWLHLNGYYGPVDLCADAYAAWSPGDVQAYTDSLWRLAAEVVRQHQRGGVLAVENFTNYARALFDQGDTMVLGCGAGWNTQGVTWDGHIVPCHRFFRAPEPFRSRRLGADLLNQVADFGPDLHAWVERCRNGIEAEECRKCSARQACPHGCPHVSWATGGALDRSPPTHCDMVRAYADIARHLAAELGDYWWRAKPTLCQPFTE